MEETRFLLFIGTFEKCLEMGETHFLIKDIIIIKIKIMIIIIMIIIMMMIIIIMMMMIIKIIIMITMMIKIIMTEQCEFTLPPGDTQLLQPDPDLPPFAHRDHHHHHHH